MLISGRTQLDVLLRAQAEIRGAGSSVPTARSYETKLAQVWARAVTTRAYHGIGAFRPEAFAALPLTRREQLKADPWSYVAVPWARTVKYYETTGTSGRVTPTPRTVEDVVWNAVVVAEAWRCVLRDSDRVAVLLPSDIVPVADLVVSVCEYLGLSHTRLYPFTTGITDYDRVIGLWRTLRPTVVFMAPGVMLQLTRLLKQRGELAALSESVRTVMLLGEVSTEVLRGRLGEWWQAAVHDASYGSTETGTLAATCDAARLHLLTTTNLFELARADGTVGALQDGGKGRLVVTPLNLHARPLLRFDTGDEVELSTGCACGDQAPTVVIRGRSADALTVRDRSLNARAVEEVVYSAAHTTGYLIETDTSGGWARLLLERDASTDRNSEPNEIDAVQQLSATQLGLRWDSVSFVNTLPHTTKAGGAQKSWKRSNIRILDAVS
ncbi:MAG: phenylacetate--CoA ligase family protein [Kibdelosporangium sp.]